MEKIPELWQLDCGTVLPRVFCFGNDIDKEARAEEDDDHDSC